MQEVGPWLQSLELRAAIHFGSLSMVPLHAAARPSSGYLTLAEALASQQLRVGEVPCHGSMTEIAFENLASERDILLLDGDELVGGQQGRVLNLTILVAAGTRVVIPVSGFGPGRWRHTTPEFATGDNACAGRNGEYRRAFEAQPGQMGAVFVIDGSKACSRVGLELFDSAQIFGRVFPRVLDSFAMASSASASEPVAGTAQRKALEAGRVAARMIGQLVRCEPQRSKATGEGEDLRFEAPGVVGDGLYARGRLVHLAAFRHPGTAGRRP